MTSLEDKIKGVANQTIGKVKEEIGRATHDTELESEGVAQSLKGKAQKTVGDVKDSVKSGIDKL